MSKELKQLEELLANDREIIEDNYKEIERLNNKIHDISETLNETYNDRTKLRNENTRLNNIINKGIEAINVYQNEKTLSVGYQDLKRIRGILQGNEFDLQMFEEYLQELKGENNE